METKHKYQFGKKRETSHEKGKCPMTAMAKRRGKVELSFIEDKAKRHQALEYASMTGDNIKLQIRDEYFDAEEARLVKTQGSSTIAPEVPRAEIEKTMQTDRQTENQPNCSNATLSLKAVRTAQTIQTEAATRKETELGIQCSLIESVGNHLGNERFCRICGKLYDSDCRKEHSLWIGCDNGECDYWLHAKCLLGESKNITAQFCNTLPYLCPFHRN